MKEKLERRLEELQNQFDSGRELLVEAEAKVFNIKESMLRISGAIQVLKEELEVEADELISVDA